MWAIFFGNLKNSGLRKEDQTNVLLEIAGMPSFSATARVLQFMLDSRFDKHGSPVVSAAKNANNEKKNAVSCNRWETVLSMLEVGDETANAQVPVLLRT